MSSNVTWTRDKIISEIFVKKPEGYRYDTLTAEITYRQNPALWYELALYKWEFALEQREKGVRVLNLWNFCGFCFHYDGRRGQCPLNGSNDGSNDGSCVCMREILQGEGVINDNYDVSVDTLRRRLFSN